DGHTADGGIVVYEQSLYGVGVVVESDEGLLFIRVFIWQGIQNILKRAAERNSISSTPDDGIVMDIHLFGAAADADSSIRDIFIFKYCFRKHQDAGPDKFGIVEEIDLIGIKELGIGTGVGGVHRRGIGIVILG